jgi:hypothetical protein
MEGRHHEQMEGGALQRRGVGCVDIASRDHAVSDPFLLMIMILLMILLFPVIDGLAAGSRARERA